MGLPVETPPIDEKSALEVVERVREGVKRGAIKHFFQIGAEEIEQIEKYISRLIAMNIAIRLGASRTIKRAEIEWVDISPSSVHVRLEVESKDADICSPGDFGCVEAKARELCERRGYERKLVIKYPGKRVTAKKHIVYHGNSITYDVSASYDSETAGLDAMADPDSIASVLSDAILQIILA